MTNKANNSQNNNNPDEFHKPEVRQKIADHP